MPRPSTKARCRRGLQAPGTAPPGSAAATAVHPVAAAREAAAPEDPVGAVVDPVGAEPGAAGVDPAGDLAAAETDETSNLHVRPKNPVFFSPACNFAQSRTLI